MFAMSSSLDPFPSCLLKKCIDAILPSITRIVNQSLTSGRMPSSLKSARVTPLLKKASLDKNELKNYRPISNLKFVFKTIERVGFAQINEYLQQNDLVAEKQSAYRKFHSTETALLRVYNDLLQAVDHHQDAVLILLDFSAAFDTIDHQMLLQRLRHRYGISGTAYDWFSSYLRGRVHTIDINGVQSDNYPLTEGVPQGSVAGPPIFTMYTAPIGDIIKMHGIDHITYADDTQLYLVLHPSNRDNAIQRLELCIADVKAWSVQNKLMLNESKTEVLHLTSRFKKSPPFPDITICGADISPSVAVKDLGVIFDSTLQMKNHISNVTRLASFALYKIGKIRHYLDKQSTERLVHAFVTSRLDCCNSLLFGLPSRDLGRLQLIQNAAARLVTKMNRYDHQHITPVLRNLHWLKIHDRVIFKIALLTYKALNDQGPMYITELLVRHSPSRLLRSSSQALLTPPRNTNTMFYGHRAFAFAAPFIWNKLPLNIKTAATVNIFKSRLKTYLFNNDIL